MRASKIRTEIRREQIARASLGVVERHGLRGLNLARVARAVGMAPSGLYRHYAGKEAVLETVIDLIGARMKVNVAEAIAADGNALERLHGLLARHVELVERNSAIPRVVFSEELLHGRGAHQRRMYGIIRDYLRAVEQIVRDGQCEGCVRAGVDPEVASILFLGLIQPAVVLRAMSGGEFDVRAHAETGWRLLVEAIGQGATKASHQDH